ncbi:unnamed protein product [Kuraishia capsulata CBS 1993]|uniref:MOSC domain-containing protein n=1 Tax=Kuraishia capsulata CBS 1993 TaxID=1382522 RepID=W6MWW9_9ASCO|nr:uncharacterized protein KUCA_T00003955001 [Kuraishia capsulata CBS 1993]CDK27975.1 unnamed protein product [Kuraishia capsulata CBS 1993]
MESPQGYADRINSIREKEYPQLIDQGTKTSHVYLDHAGMTLYCKSLLTESTNRLLSGIMGNPHSQSLASQKTEALISSVRFKVLELFQADPMVFDLVFTLNSTAAMKMLQQGLSDTFGSYSYAYNSHSHTSAVGLREYSSDFCCFDDPEEVADQLSRESSSNHPILISWSGQSNLSGERFPIGEWNSRFKEIGTKSSRTAYTLLDASALCTTCPPSLSDSETAPDFMCLSFYKMFGMPDIGALVFKKSSALECFRGRKYFGGGTTEVVAPDQAFHVKKPALFDSLHDGTLPVHSLVQLDTAIDVHKSMYGSFENIANYVKWLTEYCVCRIEKDLVFPTTNTPMVKIYSRFSYDMQGPIVAFSLMTESGYPLGYYDFEKFASARNISLRVGTVCNPGGALKWLERTTEDVINDHAKGHKCGDHMDVMNDKPTGVVRVSLGAMSSKEDIDTLVECIYDFTIDHISNSRRNPNTAEISVKRLTIYPIKSCHGYDIPQGVEWKVSSNGLLYDRVFCLIGLANNAPLALKHHRSMVHVKPSIDINTGIMRIENQYGEFVELNIYSMEQYDLQTLASAEGKKYRCVMDTKIRDFLSLTIETPCVLGSYVSSSNWAKSGSMQNKSAFLLLTQPSLDSIGSGESLLSPVSSHSSGKDTDNDSDVSTPSSSVSSFSGENLAPRFRANILVDGVGLVPYEEDFWSEISIGSEGLVIKTMERCDRCHMITIDSNTGERDPTLFSILSRERKEKGKVYFGSNMNLDEQCYDREYKIKIGDRLVVA